MGINRMKIRYIVGNQKTTVYTTSEIGAIILQFIAQHKNHKLISIKG